MNYDVVGFIFTEKCNFTCKHCCVESHPRANTVMSIEEICRCIDDATRQEGILEIGISGGEPFLFRQHLSQIISYAAERNFSVSVTSNAFWATSEARAHALLGELNTRGLKCLNISISPFHLEFIDPERIRNAAKASLRLGMKTRVNCVYTRSFRVEDARRLLGELADHVEIVAIPCLPAGRASQQVPTDEFPLMSGPPNGSCRQHFTKLAVTAEGEVFPCCSPGGFTEPLRVGNIRTQQLDDIVAGMENNLLIQVLDTVGPSFFVPFIRRALGEGFLDGPFVDQCHLCNTMMSNAAMREVVRAALAQFEGELLDLKLDIAVLAGEDQS
jgi:pyruvate-formate lyase-activating enzyme